MFKEFFKAVVYVLLPMIDLPSRSLLPYFVYAQKPILSHGVGIF